MGGMGRLEGRLLCLGDGVGVGVWGFIREVDSGLLGLCGWKREAARSYTSRRS